MITACHSRLFWFWVVGIVLALNAGCGVLFPKTAAAPSFYSLDSAPTAENAAAVIASAGPVAAPTLIVNPPAAAPGFDSPHIVYVRGSHRHEYFSHSEWVDTPARMLAPLIVVALVNGGAFRAVVLSPSVAAGDMRLEIQIVRLEQNFDAEPSRVHFTMRAYLVDDSTRRVLTSHDFDESVVSASEDPYGGVIAANRAVQVALEKLVGFCSEAARLWHP